MQARNYVRMLLEPLGITNTIRIARATDRKRHGLQFAMDFTSMRIMRNSRSASALSTMLATNKHCRLQFVVINYYTMVISSDSELLSQNSSHSLLCFSNESLYSMQCILYTITQPHLIYLH